MDQSFTALTLSLPPEGKDVEFWAYGKARVGYRRDGRYWVDGKSIVVDGWRFIVKNKPRAAVAAPVEAEPAKRRGRPPKAAA